MKSDEKSNILSYELPHRVFVSKIYPKNPPNGSTAILYGHDFGVRILWRGGRRLKAGSPTTNAHSKSSVNGAGKDAVIIIDSDDEEPSDRTNFAQEEAQYESEEEELDLSQPAPSIIQSLDVELGSPVFHIATPDLKSSSADSQPKIFNEKIVFSATCADNSVRIVSIPLNPPSDSQEAESSRKQILDIRGHNGHQDIPNAITMTWTSRYDTSIDESGFMELEGEEESTQSPRISRRKSNPAQLLSRMRPKAALENNEDWDILIASHSPELTGLLRVYRIPLQFDGREQIMASEPILPYQTLFLTTPATHVSFSPASYPSFRHSRLLIVQPKGFLRIYDPLAPTANQQGAWIAQFSTSFTGTRQGDIYAAPLAQRKNILDAQWTTGGRNVFALLSDGEWGIWDIDQSGPKTSKPSQELSAARPLNSFALHGYLSSASAVSGTSQTSNRARASGASISASTTATARSALAPMTPNTRRIKEDKLFRGQASGLTTTASSPTSPHVLPRGGLSVRSAASSSGGIPEDSVVLWYGSEAFRIPSLAHFWARSTAGGDGSSKGSGGTLFGPGLARLDGLDLLGEIIQNVDQFESDTAAAALRGNTASTAARDVLIVTDHRLLVLSSTSLATAVAVPAGDAQDIGGGLFDRARAADDESTRGIEQSLLKRGELDLGGMHRLLDGMAGWRGGDGAGTRRVGFASGSGA